MSGVGTPGLLSDKFMGNLVAVWELRPPEPIEDVFEDNFPLAPDVFIFVMMGCESTRRNLAVLRHPTTGNTRCN